MTPNLPKRGKSEAAALREAAELLPSIGPSRRVPFVPAWRLPLFLSLDFPVPRSDLEPGAMNTYLCRWLPLYPEFSVTTDETSQESVALLVVVLTFVAGFVIDLRPKSDGTWTISQSARSGSHIIIAVVAIVEMAKSHVTARQTSYYLWPLGFTYRMNRQSPARPLAQSDHLMAW